MYPADYQRNTKTKKPDALHMLKNICVLACTYNSF